MSETGHNALVSWTKRTPEGWTVKRLKYAVRLIGEKTEPVASGLRYIGLEHVESWTGRLIETTEGEGSADGLSTRFRPNDVLFGKLRPYLAKVHRAEQEGGCSGELLVLRPTLLDSRYLNYFLLMNEFIAAVDASTYGSKMPRANWEFIGNLPTLVPSLDEQRMIADFLDRETAGVDSLVGEQNRLVDSLIDKRQAVICQFVTRGLNPAATLAPSGVEWLGEVPKHWEVCRIASLFREASDVGEDGLPILTVSIHDGVSDRQLDDEEVERKFIRIEDTSKYKKVIPSDLVYNMMRAWQGGFGAVRVPGLVSPAYVIARPRRPIVTKFMELLLRTPAAIEEMRCHSYGVADFRLRLYWDHFKTLRVALPPLAEQRGIVEAAQRETESIDALIKVIELQNEKLAEYRSALISAAVTGQIDIRNYRPQEADALCQ